MKLKVIILCVLIAVVFYAMRKTQRSPLPETEVVMVTPPVITELHDQRGSASDDVRILHAMVGDFLIAVKEPYRPPLGINEDFAKALTGGNRYGDVFLATNHPSLNEHGQIVDRWGTPYHFHPRAADAIDVRSAGPDRKLFTEDDVIKEKK